MLANIQKIAFFLNYLVARKVAIESSLQELLDRMNKKEVDQNDSWGMTKAPRANWLHGYLTKGLCKDNIAVVQEAKDNAYHWLNDAARRLEEIQAMRNEWASLIDAFLNDDSISIDRSGVNLLGFDPKCHHLGHPVEAELVKTNLELLGFSWVNVPKTTLESTQVPMSRFEKYSPTEEVEYCITPDPCGGGFIVVFEYTYEDNGVWVTGNYGEEKFESYDKALKFFMGQSVEVEAV